MNAPVSIIIPAYQEEKRIGRCLQSVLESSYRNIEIIVVNDGSTDGTAAVVQDYIEKKGSDDIKIKLVNISHGGPGRARNEGLRSCRGEFIGFADADDMMHPQMIERLVESLMRGNDLAVCGLRICDQNGKPARWQYPLHAQHRKCPVEAMRMVMWEQILMSVCPVMFRREKIIDEDNSLRISFSEDLINMEDFVFVCRYLSHCDGFLEVLPFYGIFYCRRAGSLTSSGQPIQETYQPMQMILKMGEQADDGSLIEHKIQYAFRFMAFWYKEAGRCRRKTFRPDCENWKFCMQELEKYVDIYMNADNVARYQKLAMWIVIKHPELGRFLAKTAGRKIL